MKQVQLIAAILLTTSALSLFASSGKAQTVVIPKNSVWSFNDTGTDLGTTWRDTSFDDGSWTTGTAIFGYGEGYINRVISFGLDPNDKHPTAYFRHEFSLVDDPAQITSLSLSTNFDDGYVAYLNGTEVTRPSMPAGTISYSTLAGSHEGGSYEPIILTGLTNLLLQGQNLLAIEVHQTNAISSDLVFDAELIYSTAPAYITRGPYIQVGTDTSAVIRWRTDVPVDTRLRYGTQIGDLVNVIDDPVNGSQHEVKIRGLTPGTHYYYAIGTSTFEFEGDDIDHSFRTAPTPGTPQSTRIWVIGDSGLPGQNAINVRSAYEAYAGAGNTDVWLMLGDNAYLTGTDAEYQAAVFDMYTDLLKDTFLWPTRGNHDVRHAGANNDYYDIFTMPIDGEAGGVPSGTEAYYSFDFGRVHFICLDSEGSDRTSSGPMVTWLRQDLAATNQDWIIAYWHHPPYTKGSHNSDDPMDSGGRMAQMRNWTLPVLDSAGVDLVLGGHSHSYERSFLLNGLYLASGSLVESMIIDSGDGNPLGDGAYAKPTSGTGPFEGAVYVVAGSSSKLGGGPLDHPVMITSLNKLGSLVIDISGERLDALFLDDAGQELDHFTILKGTATGVDDLADAIPYGARLDIFGPNPIRDRATLMFSLPNASPVELSVYDVSGRLVRSLVNEHREAGTSFATWDGRNSRGHLVSPGMYFGVLQTDRETRTRKITVVR